MLYILVHKYFIQKKNIYLEFLRDNIRSVSQCSITLIKFFSSKMISTVALNRMN